MRTFKKIPALFKALFLAISPFLMVSLVSAKDYTEDRKTESKFAVEESKKTGTLSYTSFKVGGCTVRHGYEKADKETEKKVAAVKEAIKIANDAGFPIPDFDLITSAEAKVRCVAFLGDQDGRAKIMFFLGPKMFAVTPKSSVKGVADAVPPERKGVAVALHEFGHAFHEKLNPDKFWPQKDPKKKDTNPPVSAADVSMYALQSKLEFVAEVFAGVLMKQKYSDEVFNPYKDFGGPTSTEFNKLMKEQTLPKK
ncbi:MAG: hypothetical protein HQM08_30535 [Candidatus Riflebacteria bacterium]|nr:hypothetical protein [Candidatus Riflebacteria bacterium]